MPRNKSIDEELDELTTIYQRGGGIGDPNFEQEIGRRIDYLKHKQAHHLNKKNSRITVFNVVITAINIGIEAVK